MPQLRKAVSRPLLQAHKNARDKPLQEASAAPATADQAANDGTDDIDASPEASSDEAELLEAEALVLAQAQSPDQKSTASPTKPSSKQAEDTDNGDSNARRSSRNKPAPEKVNGRSPGQRAGQKRKRESAPPPVQDEMEHDEFQSQVPGSQRSTQTYSRSRATLNIHTAPETSRASVASSQPQRPGFKEHNVEFLRHKASSQPNSVFKKPNEITPPNSRARRKFQTPTALAGSADDHAESAALQNSATSNGLAQQSVDLVDSSSSLSSPMSSTFGDDDDRDGFMPIPSHEKLFHCPVCKDVVPREFLDTLEHGRKLKVLERVEFCKSHKRLNAADLARQAGYPQVDWDQLSKRLRRLNGHLTAVIDGRQPSAFRDQLESKVASGVARRGMHDPELAIADETKVAPPSGYYGTRGSRRIQEHLVKQFGAKMRKNAVDNHLVHETGVGGFIQAVLVPECAMKLVMEDMNVNGQEAREILEKSAELGEVMNPEEEEKVERNGDDQDDIGTYGED